ncbi:hypothetical protein V499_02791 [Pseudogymnoascus sp. VKM F-103]|nr:hypothetical protein V499_02791 [Pseudogymnoascus sp. VKM F-103]
MSDSPGSDSSSGSDTSSEESPGNYELRMNELGMAEVLSFSYARSPSPPALEDPKTPEATSSTSSPSAVGTPVSTSSGTLSAEAGSPTSTSSRTLSLQAGTPTSTSSKTLSLQAGTPTSSSEEDDPYPVAQSPTSTFSESTSAAAPKTPTKSPAAKNPPCTSLSAPYPESWTEKLWSPPSSPELPSQLSLHLPSPVRISPEPFSPAPWWPVSSSPTPEPGARTTPASPPPPPPERVVIAIAGPTSSGKTTLSNLLLHVFGNGSATPGSGFTSVALHQDDYFVPSNLPTGPQVQWAECYLEEWMGERLASRACMFKGFAVEEADRITPVHEEILIREYRDVHARRWNAPHFDAEVLSLQLRSGKNRDTRLVTDFFALAIAIARAKASMLDSDMEIAERGMVTDYSFLLEKPSIDGPEIEDNEYGPRDPSPFIKEEESIKGDGSVNGVEPIEIYESIEKDEHIEVYESIEKDESIEKYESTKNGDPIKEEEPILEDEILGHDEVWNITKYRIHKPRWPPYKVDHGIYGPYLQDPTMVVPKKGKSGYIKNPIKPNSLIPHHCFAVEPNSLQYPELPDGTRKLLPVIVNLRLQVQRWIEAMTTLNELAGFPGLNFIDGKFRGIVFVEGFTILQPAEVDPAAHQPNYDLSLFLSATREGTRKRRFARKEYNKPLMKRYMTWREKSYFDGVAWPAFVEEHQWIFNMTPQQAKEGLMPDAKYENVSDLAKERGLEVRPGEMGIKETLEWAMRKIMNEFGFKEKTAREKWVEEKNAREYLAKEQNDWNTWVDEENAFHMWVNKENVREMSADEDNDGDVVEQEQPGEWIQENLMDEDDIDFMFEIEKRNLDITDAIHRECRDDGQVRDDADPYWGRHGAVEDEDFDYAADPWWGMQDDNLVEEVYYSGDFKNLDWEGDDGMQAFGTSDSE